MALGSRPVVEAVVPHPLVSRLPRAVSVLGLAALTALAAQIRIPLPFTPVPITGQVFAVVLSGYLAGATGGALSQGLYLAAGVVGLPVFSGLGAGSVALLGPTGGYLLAYVPAAWLTGLLGRRARTVAGRAGAGLAALALIYLGGTLWLGLVSGVTSARLLLTWSLTPFLGLDLVKVLLAERLSRSAGRHTT